MLLRVSNQLRYAVDRNIFVDDENVERAGYQSHRRKIFEGIERHLRVQARVHGEGRCRHEQRVPVGLAARDHAGADDGPGARPVVDDHVLAQVFGHLIGQDARDGIGATTGRERHDEPDRLVGIGRLRSVRRQGCEREADQGRQRRSPRDETPARGELARISGKQGSNGVVHWHGLFPIANIFAIEIATRMAEVLRI